MIRKAWRFMRRFNLDNYRTFNLPGDRAWRERWH